MPPQLTGLRGGHAGTSFSLGDAPISLGRSPENTIVLASARASRHHAEIRRDGADYVLTDLGSANGTLINGRRLTAPYRLRPGDIFEVGEEAFRFDASPAMVDATIVAAPAVAAPPTAPADPHMPLPAYQPPAQSPAPAAPAQGNAPGVFPTPPAHAASVPPKKSGVSRTLLIVLGLVSFVFVAACLGGLALVVMRGRPVNDVIQPTSVLRPTPEDGSNIVAPPNENDPVPTRAPVAGAAEWTVLVYLDGDNNLEGDALADFNEMERIGSSDQIKIVVQLDRIHQQGAEDDTSNGDWDTTKRFLIEQDDDETQIRSRELADLGELNMGDPQTLVDFITWGVEQYPARRYAVILWDHGSSWAGVAFDDTDGEKGIRLPELDAAFRTAQRQTGIERFDLIGFDACLMAQIDVLDTIAPYGSVAVASAELEPNQGWAWDAALLALAADPAQDAATFAKAIVQTYGAFYENGDDDTPTLSAFDLSRVGALRESLNALSDAMIQHMNGAYPSIAEARSYATAYSQPRPEEFSAVDLGDFAQLIGKRGGPAEIAAPAQALFDVIEQARIAEWNAGFHSRSTGMSVFFPQVAELYPDFYEQASPLPQKTSWAVFLKQFYQAGTTQVSAPAITDLRLSDTTAGINNPVTLEGAVSGSDIAYVFFFVGVPNGDGSSVQLTDIDFIYPPGSSPNAEVPPWDDGSYTLNATWNATQWALSNGIDTIPVLLGPAKYGTDLYGVEGIYTFRDTGEQIAAGLLFQVRQGRATLQTIWGFPKGKQETQPFEISPVAGDTFTALLRSYTVQGDRLVPDLVQGETITFGDQPLSAFQVPATSGDYVIGFLVRDISGHFNYQYEQITVDNSGAGPVNPAEPTQPPAGPGSQAGTLAFSSQELGFALEYPDTWQTLDTGNDQVYFYDPDQNSASFVSVDVYSTDQQPAQANQLLLSRYAGALSQEQDFKQGEVKPFRLAGEEGLSFQYTYTDKNGNPMFGMAIVVTSPNTGLSYLVTVQALESDYDSEVNTFNAILESMRIQ